MLLAAVQWQDAHPARTDTVYLLLDIDEWKSYCTLPSYGCWQVAPPAVRDNSIAIIPTRSFLVVYSSSYQPKFPQCPSDLLDSVKSTRRQKRTTKLECFALPSQKTSSICNASEKSWATSTWVSRIQCPKSPMGDFYEIDKPCISSL